MVAGDQQLVHTPFVPAAYWSPCAPLIWDPVKAPDIRFSSSHFRKQHPHYEKAVLPQYGQSGNESRYDTSGNARDHLDRDQVPPPSLNISSVPTTNSSLTLSPRAENLNDSSSPNFIYLLKPHPKLHVDAANVQTL
ncbi:unnamed protein product [Schistosoma margrebowiei]|uniref:Uncharacterized protein n=1 Tax=Schistosoma margrebowiei TaxID=48269 RepID=A0A183M5D2_9TREM|nr:unnamed protein product [Schistosoma margrebowiei]